jgi:hypothetical protein
LQNLANKPLARQSGLAKNDTALMAHIIILDGQIVGGWKRILKKDPVIVRLDLLTTLTKAEKQAITVAAEQYGKFLGLAVNLV